VRFKNLTKYFVNYFKFIVVWQFIPQPESWCSERFLFVHCCVWASPWSSGSVLDDRLLTTSRVQISAWAYLKVVSSLTSPHYLIYVFSVCYLRCSRHLFTDVDNFTQIDLVTVKWFILQDINENICLINMLIKQMLRTPRRS
jgi:hypothetical protein